MLESAVALLFASPSIARCPRSPARIVSQLNVTLPANPHATRSSVRFAIDLGSDGRVRRIVTIDSSGDPAVDETIASGVEHARFDAPTFSCMASSSAFIESIGIPAEARPSPLPSAVAPATVTPSVCDAPFVTPAGIDVIAREPRGTVALDVELDAAAHVDAVHLVRSSGNARTDEAAIAGARAAGYQFVTFPGCPAAPTTYHLEITFR